MKRYTKIIAFLLIAVMTLGLFAACGGNNDETPGEYDPGKTPQGETIVPDDGPSTPADPDVPTDPETPGDDEPTDPETPGDDEPTDPETPGDDEPTDPETPGDDEPADPETPGDDEPTDPETPGNDEPTTPETPSTYNTTCMTYNVLASTKEGFTDPAQRAPWILSTITKYDPDLLGMQEITKATKNSNNFDMYQYLIDNLSAKYDSRSLLDEGKDGAQIGVTEFTTGSGLVLFYKKDRFELKDSGAYMYTNNHNRHYQWVKLYDKQEQVTVLFTNTHFSPHDDGTNGPAEAQQMVKFWEKEVKDGMPMYGTGDYNHGRNSAAFEILNRGNVMSSYDVADESSASAELDYIYINDKVQYVHDYQRIDDTHQPAGAPNPGVGNNMYFSSDHRPVIIYCSNPNAK